ncbi:MAG: Rne/Rng family ribonuclease [Magnetococcales bacterium]|nr:Rne/Rng family ribonuclease [Magnetococcales bacterium]
MTKRMLVDATHPEEVRVAIIQDNRLNDLEIETAAKEQIKGNIYLGKVSRVEPSLQAAFIDFGNGRQGFLPLNDIHEKYFPAKTSASDAKKGGRRGRSRSTKTTQAQAKPPEPQISQALPEQETPPATQPTASPVAEEVVVTSAPQPAETTPTPEAVTEEVVTSTPQPTEAAPPQEKATDPQPLNPTESPLPEEEKAEKPAPKKPRRSRARKPSPVVADTASVDEQENQKENQQAVPPTTSGETETATEESESAEEEKQDLPERPARRSPRRRPPPIQQILTRGQTVLVQVVKEARGNKGASLTTNISLAGRYSVLLPENSGGGGISRKISDGKARKSLKEILSNLEVPKEVSLIIRTAGLDRTKREILRDMNYMLRVWKKIKEKSEKSEAPCLIHEEGDLITRTIRDLYTTDMEEILIEGHECYRRGKDFMRLLMPSYVKVVQPYKDSIPLFSRYQVENQIETMHNRIVQLKSGGYLVIESTEAMVTIDINSGRSTKEKDIETTAYKTNLLAADEIARQLRLRDLGGLVVIDFIDMGDKKHNTEVEKRVKEAFKNDRARIQIGRISQFGLLELSRQRMKPAFNESNRQECPRCKGSGTIRAVDSSAIYLFRCIEEELSKGPTDQLVYFAPQSVVNYIFNNKRSQLVNLEQANNVSILIHGDPEMQPPEFRLEKPDRGGNTNQNNTNQNKKKESNNQQKAPAKQEQQATPPPAPAQSEGQESTPAPDQQSATIESSPTATEAPVRKKRRRRRRRRRSTADQGEANTTQQQSAESGTPQQTAQPLPTSQPSGKSEAQQPSSQVESGEAIPTTVPGIYVLPDTKTPSQTSSNQTGKNQTDAAASNEKQDEEGETKEAEAPKEKPRRRRRRRRPSRSQKSEEGQTPDSAPTPTTDASAPPTKAETAPESVVSAPLESAPVPKIAASSSPSDSPNTEEA